MGLRVQKQKQELPQSLQYICKAHIYGMDTALHCTALHCTALHCTALHWHTHTLDGGTWSLVTLTSLFGGLHSYALDHLDTRHTLHTHHHCSGGHTAHCFSSSASSSPLRHCSLVLIVAVVTSAQTTRRGRCGALSGAEMGYAAWWRRTQDVVEHARWCTC